MATPGMPLQIMKTLLLLTLCLALSACATRAPVKPVIVSGETILLQGLISQATAIEFKDALQQGRISRVLLHTGGGHVEPAIAIAKEIRDRKMEVEVVGDCLSSCANYIFPAGASKTISGLGIVGWHGNMTHRVHLHAIGKKLVSPDELAEFQRLAVLENEFFKSIGVDPYLCWFAKMEPYNARNFYFLDPEDMARFGVTDVKVRSGYARTDVSGLNANGRTEVEYVKVDWSNMKRPEGLQ